MSSAFLPRLRVVVGILFFTLSDSNADKMIANIGYGYSAGILTNLGLAAKEPLSDTSVGGEPINPITGQARAYETGKDGNGAHMSNEEKESEAERLFVLFERLKQTGIVDVKNPIAEAPKRAI